MIGAVIGDHGQILDLEQWVWRLMASTISNIVYKDPACGNNAWESKRKRQVESRSAESVENNTAIRTCSTDEHEERTCSKGHDHSFHNLKTGEEKSNGCFPVRQTCREARDSNRLFGNQTKTNLIALPSSSHAHQIGQAGYQINVRPAWRCACC